MANADTFHFGLPNDYDEPNCQDVPKLFRRVADAIDDLGDVFVYDMVLETVATPKGYLPLVEVYYTRHERPPRPHVPQLYSDAFGNNAEPKVDAEHAYVSSDSARDFPEDDPERSFSVGNPFNETDFRSTPKLLRRVADVIDRLGGVHVDDMVLYFEEYTEATVPKMRIHYSRPDRAERHCGPRTQTAAQPEMAASKSENLGSVDIEPELATTSQDQKIKYFMLKDRKNQPGYLSRPRLLRQTADALEELGDIELHNLVLHEELTDGKWVPEHVSFVTAYYNRLESSDSYRDDDVNGNSAPGRVLPENAYLGEYSEANMVHDRTNRTLRLHNSPFEAGYLSVPKLLRQTADAVDAMPKAEIDDLILHSEMTPAGRVPTVAVYYSHPSPSDKQFRKEWRQLAQDEKRRAKRKKRRKREKKKQRGCGS